jgi:hypothetical protein
MEAERFARARELHTLVDHLPTWLPVTICSYAGPTRAMAVFMLGRDRPRRGALNATGCGKYCGDARV